MYRIILEKMQEFLPCLNKRIVTLKEGLQAACKLGAIVRFLPNLGGDDGYFIPPNKKRNKKPYIFIEARLSESEQAETLVHELTHLVCHFIYNLIFSSSGRDCDAMSENEFDVKCDRDRRRKFEREALAMQSLAAIPRKDLPRAQRELFDFDLPSEHRERLWRMRIELYSHGI